MENPEKQFTQSKLTEESKKPESKQENLEELEEIQEDQLIEFSQKVGDFYVSLIEELTKMGELKKEILDQLPGRFRGKLKDFVEGISKHTELQHMQFSLGEKGAKDLLLNSMKDKGLERELIDDQSKYRLEEVSSGIFVVLLDKDLYSKLYGKNVAVATLEKDGISFISMPKEYQEAKSRNNLYKENLLHEAHHIAWSFLLKEGKIKIEETDKDRGMAYRFFQDELMARLCSGGGFMGYSHLLLMDEKSLKEFRTQNPDKEEEINRQVADLNTMIYEEIVPFMEEAGVKKRDLILSVVEAKNFSGLEINLRKLRTAIEQRASINRKSNVKAEAGKWNIST